MSEPKIAAKQPAAVQLEAGKTYAWCACGLSKNQPFLARTRWSPARRKLSPAAVR